MKGIMIAAAWLALLSFAPSFAAPWTRLAPWVSARPSTARAVSKRLSLADIRALVRASGGTLVQMIQADGGVLVEARSGGLLSFTWYDLATGRHDELPVGTLTMADVVQILGSTDITLRNLGPDSDGSFWPFPYEIHCVRHDDTSAFACGQEEAYFPVTTPVEFGSKPDEALAAILYTLDGLEIAFGPERGQEGGFMADYTSIPPVKTGFDTSTGTFTLTFQDAVARSSFPSPVGANAFVRAVTVRRAGADLVVAVRLKASTAKYFTGSIEWLGEPLPFLEIRFSAGDWSGVPPLE